MEPIIKELIKAGDVQSLAPLVEKDPSLAVREVEDERYTEPQPTPPLVFAVREQQLGCVRVLLRAGAHPNDRVLGGALEAAIYGMGPETVPDNPRQLRPCTTSLEVKLEIAKCIVDAGAELNDVVSEINGEYTALGMCVQYWCYEMLVYCLKAGADPNNDQDFTMGGDDSDFQMTSLGMTVGRSGFKNFDTKKYVRALLEAGASPNTRFRYGVRNDDVRINAFDRAENDEEILELLHLQLERYEKARKAVFATILCLRPMLNDAVAREIAQMVWDHRHTW